MSFALKAILPIPLPLPSESQNMFWTRLSETNLKLKLVRKISPCLTTHNHYQNKSLPLPIDEHKNFELLVSKLSFLCFGSLVASHSILGPRQNCFGNLKCLPALAL